MNEINRFLQLTFLIKNTVAIDLLFTFMFELSESLATYRFGRQLNVHKPFPLQLDSFQ